MKKSKAYFYLLGGFLLVACSDDVDAESTAQKNSEVMTASSRGVTTEQLKHGRALYLKNCTVCHGLNAEGSPDWRQRDANGKFPPPPLNGTGHAWHHPKRALMDTIKHGTQRLGGNMPPWKDRLSDAEIELIIFWLQSQWPPQLYEAWQRMDRESQQRQEERR